MSEVRKGMKHRSMLISSIVTMGLGIVLWLAVDRILRYWQRSAAIFIIGNVLGYSGIILVIAGVILMIIVAIFELRQI